MNTTSSTPPLAAVRLCIPRFPVALLLVVALPLFVGCGRRAPDSALQDQVDFTDASNLFSAPIPEMGRQMTPETVLAVVDGSPITFGDLEKEVNVLLVNAGRANLPPEQVPQFRARLSEQAMQNLVIKRLLSEAIEQNDVVVSDDELDLQIEQFRQTLPAELTFEGLLERNQLTEAAFREDLRQSMRVERLLQEKVRDLSPPTDEAIEAFYRDNPERFAAPERVTLRHLLISVPEGADAVAREQMKADADALLQQLQDGADFAELAAQRSDDLPNREQGGLLSNITRGQLPPALEARAFSLDPGELGPVIETHFGFHLIQVEERTPAGTIPLEDARESIAGHLMRRNQQEVLESYVNRLREEASIELIQP